MNSQAIRVSPVRKRWLCAFALLVAMRASAAAMARTSPWSAVGPDGGDARSFVAVPNHPEHLFLGTTNSWIYESTDRGATWRRLGRLDDADDLVLDHVIVNPANPSNLLVAAWSINHKGGGIWSSHDGGRTWKETEGLRGQSIRAFTSAASNPNLLVAGTLDGVFRSMDGGASWTQISPAGSKEIHEIESLAINAEDPAIIYAGTWHLPWKTTDGGRNWASVKQGLMDDSDVFSIIIDPKQPDIVYASTCSGIYKSDNAGKFFRKIQGIPYTAHRTRVLKQDPVDQQVVYAGTTEGLYKTIDGGKTFKRMTGPDVIVNDVFVDPKDTQHVLLATDRSGVLLSNDAGASFVAANEGFSSRQVEALLVDAKNPSKLYAGVVNDKIYGGVFVSSDAGNHWEHIGKGLDGRDVFALAQAPDGTLLAGTNHGIFSLVDEEWVPRNAIVISGVTKLYLMWKGKKVPVEMEVKDRPETLDGRVFGLDLSGDAWLASTTQGVLTSRDHGATWRGGPVLGSSEYLTVATHGSTFVAAKRDGVAVSRDAGQTWHASHLPAGFTRIDRAVFSADGTAWLGGREGVYVSKDEGKSWKPIERFPLKDVNDLYYDATLGKVLVSSRGSDLIYEIDPAGLNWTWARAGWKVYKIRSAGGYLVGASLSDGVLVEPRFGGVQSTE